MEKQMNVEKTIAALQRHGYAVSFFEMAEAAATYLNSQIDQKSVGFGDSETIAALHLYDSLSDHNAVTDPMHRLPGEGFRKTAKRCLLADVFLTSVNAMSETGEMVNIDRIGNRISGSLFGHEKVYFVVGVNKLVPTLEDAIQRARQYAAPQNAARHGFLTPCAQKKDRCYDCSAEQRICNVQVVYYRAVAGMKMEVVLINQSLGI